MSAAASCFTDVDTCSVGEGRKRQLTAIVENYLNFFFSTHLFSLETVFSLIVLYQYNTRRIHNGLKVPFSTFDPSSLHICPTQSCSCALSQSRCSHSGLMGLLL